MRFRDRRMRDPPGRKIWLAMSQSAARASAGWSGERPESSIAFEVRAVSIAQRTEVMAACNLLNWMCSLGMPHSQKLAA